MRGHYLGLLLIKDTDRHARILRLFTKVKNCDLVSFRDTRNEAAGLQQQACRQLLTNYLLTKNKDLSSLFSLGYEFAWESGIRFMAFDGSHLFFPRVAHFIEVKMMYAKLILLIITMK